MFIGGLYVILTISVSLISLRNDSDLASSTMDIFDRNADLEIATISPVADHAVAIGSNDVIVVAGGRTGEALYTSPLPVERRSILVN